MERFSKELKQKTKAEIATVDEGKKFSTFQGVYRPTLLTILGLIMYLRQGWIVGNTGLVGMILIIVFSFLITGVTAASISVIVSNTRIGKGGVFSLVSQSLGLKVGGSIGVPLFLAQGVSAPFYIFGFAEAWQFFFPDHPTKIILITMFLLIAVLSAISTSLAFRMQFLVMLGVIAALFSIFSGLFNAPVLYRPELWGGFQDGDFWKLFSIYFPAATGVMVGSSMSGNLKNPKKKHPNWNLFGMGDSLIDLSIVGGLVWDDRFSRKFESKQFDSHIRVSIPKIGCDRHIGLLHFSHAFIYGGCTQSIASDGRVWYFARFFLFQKTQKRRTEKCLFGNISCGFCYSDVF